MTEKPTNEMFPDELATEKLRLEVEDMRTKLAVSRIRRAKDVANLKGVPFTLEDDRLEHALKWIRLLRAENERLQEMLRLRAEPRFALAQVENIKALARSLGMIDASEAVKFNEELVSLEAKRKASARRDEGARVVLEAARQRLVGNSKSKKRK